MRITALGSILIAICFFVFFELSYSNEQKVDKLDGVKNDAQIRRGEYLVNLGGCNDCHSPKIFTPKGPMPDPDRLLSGHPSNEKLPNLPKDLIDPDKWGGLFSNDLTAWVGPWGASFASNLTPDEQTGIGLWTEELFIKTMRTGKHLGAGRDILPPMPWYSLAKLSDDDLKAIFAYLRTIKPIKNLVPAPIPPSDLAHN
jgi:mono/diheme cytochrome c family protein